MHATGRCEHVCQRQLARFIEKRIGGSIHSVPQASQFRRNHRSTRSQRTKDFLVFVNLSDH